MNVINIPGYLTPMGHESLTVTNAVKTLTNTKYKPRTTMADRDLGTARQAFIQVEGASVRVWFDTTDAAPDASTGHLYLDGDTIVLESYEQMRQFQAIRVSTDATLRVSYWR